MVARGGVQCKAGRGGCHPSDLEPDEEVGDKAGRDGNKYACVNVCPQRKVYIPFFTGVQIFIMYTMIKDSKTHYWNLM